MNALAAPKCKYVLNQEDYWENGAGVLTIGSESYKCESLYLGSYGDIVTACKDPLLGLDNVYNYIITFDGAEANFLVSEGLNKSGYVCEGIATTY